MSSNLRILKIRKNHKDQAIRSRPEGLNEIVCTIVDKKSGVTLTSALGRKTRKNSAAGNAKSHALLKLKKRQWLKYKPELHEIKYA